MTSTPTLAQLEQALDRAAARSRPDDLGKLDRQFADKLARIEADKGAPDLLARQLRVLWQMLKAPDAIVPWQARALIMAAIGFFVSPLDLLPDWAPLGYVDDTVVVAIVHRRLRAEIDAFEKART